MIKEVLLEATRGETQDRSLLIVDKAPVLHTRAVGKGGMYDVIKGGVAAARDDRIGVTEVKPTLTTYAAVLPDSSLKKVRTSTDACSSRAASAPARPSRG